MSGYFNRSGLVSKKRKFIFRRLLYFFITLLSLFVCQTVDGQRAKIDSLKKALPSLHDGARVDCLNVLSLAYTYLNVDTANSYAQQAYTGALTTNYLRGMGMALNNKARIAGVGLHDFQSQEKISIQAIQLYKNSRDEKVLAETHMNLALALFCQSYFDRSVEACVGVVRLSEEAGDKTRLGEAIAVMGSISFERGNYEKSFEYFNKSLGVFKSIHDSYNTAILLAKIGDLYGLAGDNKTALSFYVQSLKYPKGASLVWHPLVDLGDTYYSFEQYDSALYDQEKYMQTIKSLTIRSNYMTFPRIRIAEMQIASKEYDKALTLLIEDLKLSKKRHDKNQVIRLLFDIARAYEGKNDYAKAFYYSKTLLQNAQDHKAKQYIRDGYKLISILYDKLHNVDSAYSYYRKYTDMKDSVAFGGFSKKLAIYIGATENEKKQAQIELLNKEKLINQQQLQLSRQKLKDESFRMYILIAAVAVFLLVGIILWRNYLQQKTANNLLQKQKEEIQNTLSQLKATQTQLIQSAKMASLGELTAGIAHEIQNPLNFVNNFSEVNAEMIDELREELKSGNVDEALAIAADIKENEQKISLHGKRADGIVKGMLQHSRSGSGSKELTNINALSDEYIRLAYHGLKAKDKTFHAEMVNHFDPHLPKVNVLQQDIGRVFLNLYNNAFYAVNQKQKTAGDDYKPEVSVTTYIENNHVIIKVKDNGVGIPDSIKEKIMQPFFTTKPTGEGTGLGLSLTYDMVVKGHEGSIEVNSIEGEGSEFIIQLPVKPSVQLG